MASPFPAARVVPEDRVAAIHDAGLRLLEEEGIEVLLPEARGLFAAAGARVEGDLVRIGRDIVEGARVTAPARIETRAATRARDVILAPGRVTFQPGAGAPNATDRLRGRRAATLADFRELLVIAEAMGTYAMVPPIVEAGDVPVHLRHLAMVEAVLTLTEGLPALYARGRGQVAQSFEMVATARGLSDAEFAAAPHCYTVINTNSPRRIDAPMAQGLIDFARAGQVAIVTPFALMGAMAPVTVAGAATLAHAEALAAIALSQLARPGAPVLYGSFASNVDMRSGAPAFGTPAHWQATVLAGQLARHLGLPWRSATGTAAAVHDVQAAAEMQFGLWGCLLAGATVVIHAGGWLEGGLTVSYETLVADAEVVAQVLDLAGGVAAGEAEIGYDDALTRVAPGGHFFDAPQTMQRYARAFPEPRLHETMSHGTWSERGGRDAQARATGIWEEILARPAPRRLPADRADALGEVVRRVEAAGGAMPEV